MLLLPAFMWRPGRVVRAMIIGLCLGGFLGALGWLDSGMPLAGLAVFVTIGLGSTVWAALRATRHWPGADGLSGHQRMQAVVAARRGIPVDDRVLASAVVDYARGVRAAVETRRLWHWVVVAVLIVAVCMAVWDAVAGSIGNLVVSVIYIVLLALELFWWPPRQARLLRNVDRAAELSRPIDLSD